GAKDPCRARESRSGVGSGDAGEAPGPSCGPEGVCVCGADGAHDGGMAAGEASGAGGAATGDGSPSVPGTSPPNDEADEGGPVPKRCARCAVGADRAAVAWEAGPSGA